MEFTELNGTIREMNCTVTRLITSLLCVGIAILWAYVAWGAVVYVPEVDGKSGESVDIPIMIDQADNLAGVKLVMEYDSKILFFQKGAKTSHTDSLMHIINDKTPGKLIIVMAGAKGIKGKAFPIFTLTFKIKKGLKENRKTQLAITEVQLMTDEIKDIKCEIKVKPLMISPQQKKIILQEDDLRLK